MVMDHQGKSLAIRDALAAAGCGFTDSPAHADVLLIDHDLPAHGRLPAVEACVNGGGKAFLYPHGAEPTIMCGWDGLYPISPLLSGALVNGPGHAEVARLFGYHHPVYDIGWSLSDLRPRRTCEDPVNVLFAPMHPPWECGWNAPVFERLLATPARITVRHLGSLEENGIRAVDGVEYVAGHITDFDGMLAQIDAADVVVAPKGTFMCLSVARGAPVVTWRSEWAKNNDFTLDAANLDRYVHRVRYPFDADHGDIWDLIRASAADVALQQDWCDRFIGRPMDVAAMLRAFEDAPRRRVLPDPEPAPVVPGLTTDPVALHRAAVACAGDGRLELARDLLAQAIGHSVDLELLNDLAVVSNALGAGQDARALLRAVLSIDPGHADAARNLMALGRETASVGGAA